MKIKDWYLVQAFNHEEHDFGVRAGFIFWFVTKWLILGAMFGNMFLDLNFF